MMSLILELLIPTNERREIDITALIGTVAGRKHYTNRQQTDQGL